MVPLADNFAVLTDCLRATGIPLATSAVLSLSTGICLAELKRRLPQSRKVDILIWAHFIPLLIPPVLLVAVLHLTLESAHFTYLAQSTLLLAVFGYLFHAGITLALVSRIFHWNERVDTLRRLILNLPKRRLIWSGLFLTKIAPVVSFCLAATMILEESMITAPFFTTRQTLVSVVRDLSRHASDDTSSNLQLILTVLGAFVLMLLLSYWIPILVGRALLVFAAATLRPTAIRRPLHMSTHSWSIYMTSLLPLCSFVLICTASILALSQLLWQGRGASLIRSMSLLSTLVSLSIGLGTLSFFVIVVQTITGFRSGRADRRAFDPLAPLALLPPALIGTVGLALTVGPASEKWILAISLGGYAYLMMSLVLNPASLRKDRQLFRNALKCQLPLQQLTLVVISSRVGGTLPVALLGLYMLWIEDGIQVTIGGHSDNLAYAVRGLKNGLQDHIYAGSLITFAIWCILAFLCVFLTSRRHRLINSVLEKRYRIQAAILLAAFAACCIPASLGQTPVRSHNISNCILARKDLNAGATNILRLPACRSVEIPTLPVSVGALHLQVQHPTASIHIKSLIFQSERPTLYIEGATAADAVELSIDTVATTPNSTLSELRFRNIRLSRFAITGSLGRHQTAAYSGDTSIIFLPTATVQDFHLHHLAASAIDIILPRRLTSSVHIDGLIGRSIFVHGDEETARDDGHNPVDIRESTTLTNVAPETAKLQELTLTDINLAASSTEPARLSISGVTLAGSQVNLTGQSLVQLRLEDLVIPSDTVSTFEAAGLGPDSRLSFKGEALGLDGTLSIRAAGNMPFDSLLLDSVQPTQSTADSRLDIASADLGSVTLSDLAVSHLALCGNFKSSSLNFNVRHVLITDDVAIPPDVINRPWTSKYGTTERSSFLRILQERGLYCDSDQAPIGLDALYYRKKLQLSAVHPLLAMLVEHLTGFGIKLSKAAQTFFVLISLHFLLRLVILIMPLNKARMKGPIIRDALARSLAGTFTMREHGTHSPHIAALLETVRLCFGWVIFIQIALCSIYLGQTTLQ